MAKNDKEIVQFQRELQENENQNKLDEMKVALEEAKRIAGGYKGTTKKYVREDENGEIVLITDADESDFDEDAENEYHGENFDIAELITDN